MIEQGNLQILLEQLNKEGIERGKAEANRIISKASKKADKIVLEAEQKAKEIEQQMQYKVQEMERTLQENLKLATRDFLIHLKLAIEQDMFHTGLSTKLQNALSDPNLLKKVIFNLSRSILEHTDSTEDLSLFLSPKIANAIAENLVAEIAEKLSRGMTVKLLADESAGFRIGIEGENFVWDFTEESLAKTFVPYLLPRFRKLVYKKI